MINGLEKKTVPAPHMFCSSFERTSNSKIWPIRRWAERPIIILSTYEIAYIQGGWRGRDDRPTPMAWGWSLDAA